jgi:hypothetical protein
MVLGLAYWYWTTTPTYALTQIIAAVRNKDVDTFEKYVDVESIAYRAIDDVLHGPARESGMFGNFDSMIGVGIIGLFKPEIADIAKTQVLKFIESGQLSSALAEGQKGSSPGNPTGQAANSGQDNPGSSSPAPDSSYNVGRSGFSDSSLVGRYAKKLKLGGQLKAYGLCKQGFKGIDYLKIEGQTALVGFKFHSDKFGRDIIIEIKMEEAGGYWRVTELSNLNMLITIYLETRDRLSSSALPLTPAYFYLSKTKTLALSLCAS